VSKLAVCHAHPISRLLFLEGHCQSLLMRDCRKYNPVCTVLQVCTLMYLPLQYVICTRSKVFTERVCVRAADHAGVLSRAAVHTLDRLDLTYTFLRIN